jgi:hypothetical protein
VQFVVKSRPRRERRGALLRFDEKTMYRGRDVAAGDAIFVFASDHEGGRGLVARGVVLSAVRGAGIRVRITVRVTGLARRPLGRAELKAFRERTDARPETEVARKLYRQATNKIAGASDRAATFLAAQF